MTTYRRILESLLQSRSRLSGSVSFTDRDAVRELADLAAIHDVRPEVDAGRHFAVAGCSTRPARAAH